MSTRSFTAWLTLSVVSGSGFAAPSAARATLDRPTPPTLLTVLVPARPAPTAGRPDTISVTTDVDGDLERLVPERVAFDFARPHIVVTGDGYEIVDDGTGTPGNRIVTGDPLREAIAAAEDVWKTINPSSWSNVKMGRELHPVKIAVDGSQGIVEQNGWIIKLLQSANSTGTWSTVQSDVGVPVVRDLIVYAAHATEDEWVNQPHTASLTGVEIGHETGLLDNVRFERINFRNPSGPLAPVMLRKEPKDGSAHGTLKFYDCRFQPMPGAYADNGFGSETYPRGQKWCIKGGCRANWDVRSQFGLPWPSFESAREHYMYLDALVGPETYPAFRFGHATGSEEKGNYFVGLINAKSFVHPVSGAVVQDGTSRTFLQVVNRSKENPPPQGANDPTDWMSNGSLVLMRCSTRQIGAYLPEGGQAFTIWGHNGEVRFVDCAVDQGDANAGYGGIGLSMEFSAPGAEPYGAYPLELENGRTYATEKVVIDGFRFSVDDTRGREPIQLHGCETVELVSFLIASTSTGVHQFRHQSPFPIQGHGFCKEWDITGLVDPVTDTPYLGPFSAYPGWASNAPKIADFYHGNWFGSGANSYSLTAADIDSYPMIVHEQYRNRLAFSGDGLGSVTLWSFPTHPFAPDLHFDDPVSYMGGDDDAHHVRVTMEDTSPPGIEQSSMCLIQARFEDVGSGTATAGVDYRVRSASPRVLMPDEDEPALLDDGSFGKLEWFWIDVEGLGMGGTATKTIDLLLEENSRLSSWRYPKDSGPFVDMFGNGQRTHRIAIIPAGGYPNIEFDGHFDRIDPIDVTRDFQYQLKLLRKTDVGQNPDALNLETEVPLQFVSTGPTPPDFTVYPETVVFAPGETEKIVTVSRITSADDLDEIILRFALGSGVHANAAATGPVLYRILFDGP